MDNNKTFVFMIILSVVFLATYFLFFNKNNINKDKKTEIINEQNKEKVNEVINDNEVIKNIPSGYDIIESKNQVLDNIMYENENYKIILSNKDAIIKNAIIKYNKNQNKDNTIDLVFPQNDQDGALRLKFDSWEKDLTLSKMTGGNNLYNFEKVDNSYIFKTKIKDKTKKDVYNITKKYDFFNNENYFILNIEISKDNKELIKFNDSDVVFSIGWGPYLGIDSRQKKDNKAHKDNISYFNGEKVILFDVSNKIFKKDLFHSFPKDINDEWIASNSHYFAAVIYPIKTNQDNKIESDKKTNYSYFIDYRDKKNKNYYCGLSRKLDEIEIKSQYKIFLLPKTAEYLNKYPEFKKNHLIIKSFLEEDIMFGIGNLIGILLKFIFKFVKNYGLAIIILTFLIKLLLYPLTYKQMQSQEKMSKLQPKIKELQEKYKDKPEILNKETMKLYKKEGVNPFGGCLPMLLQMPILFAMYGLLGNMLELKSANFLWINDLSAPDAVWTFANNGIMGINSLNILPIIMIVMQIVSSLMMPDVKSNKQAQMMLWMMPIMFFIFFYNVSSGLVLYWTVMNILNTIQQLIMNYLKNKKKLAAA